MNKYSITVELHTKSNFEIEADSLEEAKEKALDEFTDYELTDKGMDNRDYNVYGELTKNESAVDIPDEKLKEINFNFKLHKNLKDLEKYNRDREGFDVDHITFATYTDESKKISCDLVIKDKDWFTEFYRIEDTNNSEFIIDHEFKPNLESEVTLMTQMYYEMEEFLTIMGINCDPKI